MEEAEEEQDLCDELELITQQVIDPVTEKETRENMKLKLVRYKQIMNKKTNFINEVGTKVKNLELDVKLSNEIVEKQTIELEDKESTKTLLKSQTKKAEKELENSKAQYKMDLEVTRETINVLTKANNELKKRRQRQRRHTSLH